jgi:uncharacterized delta-60 repeat protein
MSTKRQSHCAILRLEALEDRCVPSAGALDPTFGSGGTVITSFAQGTQNSAQALVIQPDGKIIAAGSSGRPNDLNIGWFNLARYNANGALDPTFGNNGQVQTKFGARVNANALALQPDGKVLVAGMMESGTTNAFEIVRYNSDGSLDKTFGNKGMVTTVFTQGGAQLWSLDLETVNGVPKIVAAGDVGTAAQAYFALARYDLSGSLDTSFGSSGKVVTNISASNLELNTVLASVVQGDSKIVVAGGTLPTANGNDEFALARFNTDGRLDATFGSGGVVLTSVGNYAIARAVALQSNGDIVAGGESNSFDGVFTLARYNPNGALDTSFGSGGIVRTQINGPYSDVLNGLAVQPTDGKIIAVGSESGLSALARYNVDGSLDVTFGSGGIVAPAFGQGDTAVALQSDGKIVTTAVNSGTFGVARYLPWEPQIGSFTASPNPVSAGSSLTLIASNISDANPGATITQVAFYVSINGTNTLLGYGTQSSPGAWTLTFTVHLTPGVYTLQAQGEDSDGVFGDPVAVTLSVQ